MIAYRHHVLGARPVSDRNTSMDLSSIVTFLQADVTANAAVAGVGAVALASTASMVVHWLRLERSRPADGPAGKPQRRRHPRRSGKRPIPCRQHLLTRSEQAFFSVLEPLVKHHFHITTKARVADLLGENVVLQGQETRMANQCVDFVLTDSADCRIACAVLLRGPDDEPGGESGLGSILESHGIPLLHLSETWIHHPSALKAELLKAGLRPGPPA